jgi:septation ring formation regulator EzrA
MITWIIYIIVALILFFVLYLALQGVNRGVEAKNLNKITKSKNNLSSKKSITSELKKLKKLHDEGVISKKEFNLAKKKLLG